LTSKPEGTSITLSCLTTVMRTSYCLEVILICCTLILSGCGIYTLNPKGKSEIQTIAVEPLENETSEFGLADRLTEIIIDALIADGNLKVVSATQADAVLIATLTAYDRVPETFDQNDQVQTYKVRMDFSITLRNNRDDTNFWKEKTRQEGIYDASTEAEEDGQTRAGARLVEMIINKTTKSW